MNRRAAVAGSVFSYAALFAMMAARINFLLWPVIGNSLCFLVALAVHYRLEARAGAVGP